MRLVDFKIVLNLNILASVKNNVHVLHLHAVPPTNLNYIRNKINFDNTPKVYYFADCKTVIGHDPGFSGYTGQGLSASHPLGQ